VTRTAQKARLVPKKVRIVGSEGSAAGPTACRFAAVWFKKPYPTPGCAPGTAEEDHQATRKSRGGGSSSKPRHAPAANSRARNPCRPCLVGQRPRQTEPLGRQGVCGHFSDAFRPFVPGNCRLLHPGLRRNYGCQMRTLPPFCGGRMIIVEAFEPSAPRAPSIGPDARGSVPGRTANVIAPPSWRHPHSGICPAPPPCAGGPTTVAPVACTKAERCLRCC